MENDKLPLSEKFPPGPASAGASMVDVSAGGVFLLGG